MMVHLPSRRGRRALRPARAKALPAAQRAVLRLAEWTVGAVMPIPHRHRVRNGIGGTTPLISGARRDCMADGRVAGDLLAPGSGPTTRFPSD